MPSPVPTSCSSRSEKSAHRLAVEQRVGTRPGRERRAHGRSAQPIAAEDRARRRGRRRSTAPRGTGARNRMNDSKLSMPRRSVRGIADVLGIRERIAAAHLPPRRRRARVSCGEQIVGDAHLVAIGIGAERQQRRVLGLPAESADAPIAAWPRPRRSRRGRSRRRRLRSTGSSSARIVVVGNGLDQAGAEERDRRPPRDHVRVVGDHRLAAVRRHGEEVDQRLAGVVETPEAAVRVAGSRRASRASHRRRQSPARCGTPRSSCR